MFEGFETRMVEGEGARLFCRIGGSGKPLLLLHGFPQTGAMWAGIAGELAARFTVIMPDLRGYGRSSKPDSCNGAAYTKRAMAADARAMMAALGHARFSVGGHDRGGRVAYRLALDAPEAVERLAVLDIVPTVEVWEAMDAAAALSGYHWPFLARPEPLPERLIAGDPLFYLETTLASWTASKDLSAFAADALDEYRRAFAAPGAIHALCEDYRAGAGPDRAHDEADRRAGRRIAAPTLALYGKGGSPVGKADEVPDVWRRWCDEVTGVAVPGGHFVAEEAPQETLRALLDFF